MVQQFVTARGVSTRNFKLEGYDVDIDEFIETCTIEFPGRERTLGLPYVRYAKVGVENLYQFYKLWMFKDNGKTKCYGKQIFCRGMMARGYRRGLYHGHFCWYELQVPVDKSFRILGKNINE